MISFPRGFRGSAVTAGLKASGKSDLALIVNEGRARSAAGVFTKNRIKAAPVVWSQQVVRDGSVDAVLLNSGGANACTGAEGFSDTHRCAELVAERLSISSSDVAICSTGLIGERLPMELMENGITEAIRGFSDSDVESVAHAIMTTDSVAKLASFQGPGWSIVGIAKGAGMLAPSLATMLVVVMTDAKIPSDEADPILREATYRTFERIDSDGCMSTNDTVLLLASGESDSEVSMEHFTQALIKVCDQLARGLIADAEGHTKIIEIQVVEADSESDAIEVGRAIARNNLVKCAINGQDPNWGRILAAIGTTNARFDPNGVDVSINGIEVCSSSAPGQSRELVEMIGKLVQIKVNLNTGLEGATIWTNDLSAMYVHENSAYST
jgi:glutamate N-acetyltransferase/amino-acid N-acetyltransferase